MRTDDDPMSDDDATSTSSETNGVVEVGTGTPDAPLEPFSEVLSGVMDEHDSDTTGELELPEATDDLKPHPAKSDPGFDGWLDDADPYAALTDDEDDAAAEIADWVAFTSGAADDLDEGGETDVVVDVTDTSVGGVSIVTPPVADEPPDVVDVTDVDDEPHEDTIEFFLDDIDDAGDEDMESPDDDEIVDDPPVSEPAIDEVPVEDPEETVDDDEPEINAEDAFVATGSAVAATPSMTPSNLPPKLRNQPLPSMPTSFPPTTLMKNRKPLIRTNSWCSRSYASLLRRRDPDRTVPIPHRTRSAQARTIQIRSSRT